MTLLNGSAYGSPTGPYFGGFRRTRYLGLDKTKMAGYLVASAYNLVRMVRLVAAADPA